MANTTPDDITYPDTPDFVGNINTHLAILAQSVQTALTNMRNLFQGKVDDQYLLPKPQLSLGTQATVAITATAFTAIPGLAAVTLNFTRPAWVQINLSSWAVSTAGDMRAGVALSGATVMDANAPAWGSTMYLAAQATGSQKLATKTVLVNAGSTTFTGQAFGTGGGIKQFNYGTMEIIPLRWDEALT